MASEMEVFASPQPLSRFPRQPLGEVSINLNYRGGVEGRFELTPNWCSRIVGRAAGGQVPKAIADDLEIIPPTTVKTTYPIAS